MLLLRSYSLVEAVDGSAGYTTHLVAHQWAYYYQGKRFATELGLLAVVAIGWACQTARPVTMRRGSDDCYLMCKLYHNGQHRLTFTQKNTGAVIA